MDKLCDVKATAEVVGLCTRQIPKLVVSGRFPPPVRLGRSIRWRESDLQRFIACDCDMARFAEATKGGKR